MNPIVRNIRFAFDEHSLPGPLKQADPLAFQRMILELRRKWFFLDEHFHHRAQFC